MTANVHVLHRKNSALVGRRVARGRALRQVAYPTTEDLAMLWIDLAKAAVLNDGLSNCGALNGTLEMRVPPPVTCRQSLNARLEHFAAFRRRR